MDEREHHIVIENRNDMRLSGVLQVDSSTEQRIMLKTVMGDMVIDGEGLHICHLDLNENNVVLGGRVDGISYPTKALRGKNQKASKKRLFK